MVRSQDLLMQVRYRLRDNGEPQPTGYIPISSINNKPDKGQFFSDRLIYLMLDTAQSVLFNQALAVKDEVLLSGLYAATTFTGIAQLPVDFGWYMGGVVYPPNGFAEKIARIYVGGEVEAYRTTCHYAIYIVGNTVTARWLNNYPTSGRLEYWRQPTRISGGNLNLSDFEDSVYNDWIVTQACVLLGIGEIQSQRDFKNLQIVKQKFLINGKKFVNYIENREQIGESFGSKEGTSPKTDS